MVGILASRGIEFMCGLLGVLYAGAAFVPINPVLPKERIQWMLEDTEAPVLCISRSAQANVPREYRGFRLILEDTIADAPLVANQASSLRMSEPHDLMYVIFTSGSTGRPKGVQIEHSMALSVGLPFATGQVDGTVAVGPGDRVFQFFSASFDPSIMDYMLSLLTGATLCLGTDDKSGHPWQEVLARSRPSITGLVPTALGAIQPEQLRGVKLLHVVGEAMPHGLGTMWARTHTVLNCYGPTETTIYSTTKRITPHDQEITIGKPLPNFSCYVMNVEQLPQLVEVAAGEVGELFIGGKGVGRGYLKRAELTAEKYLMYKGDRVYRSGDLAKVRPDGELLCLGRVDRQVKVKGYRIEPGEIEDAAMRHPQVRSACAVVHKGGTMVASEIFLYVMPNEGVEACDVNLKQLKAELTVHLPPYMKPALVIALPVLPMHSNGKVNFNALKENAKQDEALLASHLAGSDLLPAAKVDVEVAYDSLALLKKTNQQQKEKALYEHLGGLRTVATMLIIFSHFVVCDYDGSNWVMIWLNRASQRTAGAAGLLSLFAIIAGFTCNIGYAHSNVLSEGLRSMFNFYLQRLDRLMFTTWFTMILTTMLFAWMPPTHAIKNGWHVLYEDNAHTGSQLANKIHDDPRNFASYLPLLSVCVVTGNAWSPFHGVYNACPNGASWFIGALWPAFIFYPFVLPLVSIISRKWKTWGILAFFVLVFCIGVLLPRLVVPLRWQDTSPYAGGGYGYTYRWLETFPTFYWSYFILGMLTAELHLRHDKWARRNARTEVAWGQGSWPLASFIVSMYKKPSSIFTIRRVQGTIGDVCALCLFLWFVVLPGQVGACGGAKSDASCGEVSDMQQEAIWAPFLALFIYGSCAGGNAGMAAEFFRHPIFASAAPYTLAAYLFQDPISRVLNLYFCGDGINSAVDATSMVMLTWLVAVLYTHFLETPCVLAMRWLTWACLDACFDKISGKKQLHYPELSKQGDHDTAGTNDSASIV
jgi:amino acid adenylation domain-containing protein